ncbi:MAG TPA: hypothetical protein VFZ68_11635 [Acidimicrobiales bacterium]
MRRFGTAAAALVLALGATACSDSDGGGDEGASSERGEEYVDAITETIGGAPGIPEASSRCLASAFVEGIGVDELEDRGSPEELADQNEAFSDMTLDESQAESAYDHLGTCSDPRELLVQSVLSTQQLSEEATVCVDEAVGDDVAREFFVTLFQGNEAQQESEAMQELGVALTECAFAGAPAPPQGEPAPAPPQEGEPAPSTTAP